MLKISSTISSIATVLAGFKPGIFKTGKDSPIKKVTIDSISKNKTKELLKSFVWLNDLPQKITDSKTNKGELKKRTVGLL